MLNIYQEKYAGRRNSIWKLPSSDLVNLHGSKKTAPPSTTRTQKQKLHQLVSPTYKLVGNNLTQRLIFTISLT